MGEEELSKDELIALLYVLLHLGEGGVAVVEEEDLVRAGVKEGVKSVLESLEKKGLIEVVKVGEDDVLGQLSSIVESIEAIVLGSRPSWEWGQYISDVLDSYGERDTLLRRYLAAGDIGALVKASRIDEALSVYRFILVAGDLIKPLRKRLTTAHECLQYEKTVLYLLPLIGREAVVEPLSLDSLIASDSLLELIEREGIKLYMVEEGAVDQRIEELRTWVRAIKRLVYEDPDNEAAAKLLSGLETDIQLLSKVSDQ